MEWLATVQSLVTLLGACAALVGALITINVKLYTATKQLSKERKWRRVCKITLNAIKEAEKTGQPGESKKAAVIRVVKMSCEKAKIDLTDIMSELDDYIDSVITFANSFDEANNIGAANKHIKE